MAAALSLLPIYPPPPLSPYTQKQVQEEYRASTLQAKQQQ